MKRGVTVAVLALALVGCTRHVDGRALPSHDPAPRPSPVVETSPVQELTVPDLVDAVDKDATEYWKAHGSDFPALTVTRTTTGTCLEDGSPAGMCNGTLYYDLHALEQLHASVPNGGDVVVAEVISHEVGHALLHYTGTDSYVAPIAETRADCASGAFIASKFRTITLTHADDMFTKTPLVDHLGLGMQAFNTGFNTQRDGGNTLTTCTTYIPR